MFVLSSIQVLEMLYISCVYYIKHIFFFFSKLFHVRPVTQGDVYRAESEEIPRIFQVTKP